MKLQLCENWKVFQDVQNMAEIMEVWRPEWRADSAFFHCISDWKEIEHLAHLQCLFMNDPYSGHILRQFNAAPWWYKKEFMIPKEYDVSHATLHFDGIDYFAKVWLNGELLGEHEGYFAPAEFEVGDLLDRDGVNTVVVKVWSPFDDSIVSMKQDGKEVGSMFRFLTSGKSMIKGTYDHADGFFQRDVNPVGIYGDVYLRLHKGIRFACEPNITTISVENNEAQILSEIEVYSAETKKTEYSVEIMHPVTGEIVNAVTETIQLTCGRTVLSKKLTIAEPMIWALWDRGTPELYTVRIRFVKDKEELLRSEKYFGIRTVEMLRDRDTTAFILNGDRVFLRGTSYFPDVYLSRMTRERYQSDLQRIKAMGFNAIRVHVHVARPAFYELCDMMGLAVIQDSDLSWFYELTQAFTVRAVSVFTDMVRLLRRHTCIFCWIVMNEPDMWVLAQQRGQLVLDEKLISMMDDMPGPQLMKVLKELDPKRPYIKGSHFREDAESGDEHDYTGSITGEATHYMDNYGKHFKLLTEYGMDLPGSEENLRRIPKYFERIAPVYADRHAYGDLCEYRRRYLKYIAEYCRIQKGNPCAGYFQFLFSDVTPQSFYGIQDWWGTLKCDADAYMYSNQPVGIFMEHTKDAPVAVWAANDTPKTYACIAAWNVTDENGNRITQGSKDIELAQDSAVCISSLDFAADKEKVCHVHLMLSDQNGRILAENHYLDAFRYLQHPKGHPLRIDHELGMRLFWA